MVAVLDGVNSDMLQKSAQAYAGASVGLPPGVAEWSIPAGGEKFSAGFGVDSLAKAGEEIVMPLAKEIGKTITAALEGTSHSVDAKFVGSKMTDGIGMAGFGPKK